MQYIYCLWSARVCDLLDIRLVQQHVHIGDIQEQLQVEIAIMFTRSDMLPRCLQEGLCVSYRNNHFNMTLGVCESFSHSLYGASKFMLLMFILLFQYGGQFYLLVTDQRCLNRSCLVWEKFIVVWDQLTITCLHQSYFLLIKASKGKIKTVKCTRNKFFVVYSFEENLFPSFNMVLSEKQDKDEVHFHRNQKSCHLTFTITLSWISLMGLNW